MSAPPPYLESGFDPTRAKVAELRGVLLAHDVPYSSVAKKPQLVALYEQHIRPQAPALLAEMRAVRASDKGVLDGESQGSTSLRELDTEPEDAMDEEPAPKARARTRKSLATASSAGRESSAGAPTTSRAKGKAPSTKSKARSRVKAVPVREQDSGDEDEDLSMDEPVEAPTPKKRGRARKSVKAPTPPPVDEMDIDVDGEEDAYEAPQEYSAPIRGASEDEDDGEESEDMAAPPPKLSTSPRKRKEPATPRLSELVKKADSPSSGDGNFSDFNPFQSGGEETPQRDAKRRKSSIGPSRLRDSAEASSSRLSPRKSMPALPAHHRRDLDHAGAWADSAKSAKRSRASAVFDHAPQMEEDVPPVPPLPSGAARAKQQRMSLGVASSSGTGTPVGVPYMVPVTKIRTSDPDVAEELRRFEEGQQGRQTPAVHRQVAQAASVAATASPVRAKARASSGGRIAGPSPQTHRKSSSPVDELVPASPEMRRTARQVIGQGKQLAADVIHLRKPSSASASSSRGSSALPSLATVRSVALGALVLLGLAVAGWRVEEKTAVGYCDPSSTTNLLMAQRHTSLALPSLPDVPSRVGAFLDSTGLRPGCEPCPTHGRCIDGRFLGCTHDHVPVAPGALRTLGGILPAPSVCVPDTAKQVAVARQASAGAHLLRRRRGDVVCRGLEKARRRDKTDHRGEHDAFVFGLDAPAVFDELARANELSGEPIDERFLDEINRLALRDLVTHGDVVVWQNGDEFWYASQVAEMSLGCRARLFAKNWVREHKLTLAGLFAALAGAFWLRHKLAQYRRDNARRDQLVALALRKLQSQAQANLSDPVATPFPYIVPSHLRDLVLLSEHSPSRRAALWTRVAHVVEGNANVRVRDVEVNGEEMRGWQWTGPLAVAEDAEGAEAVERPKMVEGGARVLQSLAGSPVALGRAQ